MSWQKPEVQRIPPVSPSLSFTMYNLWFKQAHWKDNLEVVDEVSGGYKESLVDSGVMEGLWLKGVTDLWTY